MNNKKKNNNKTEENQKCKNKYKWLWTLIGDNVIEGVLTENNACLKKSN